eukprot:TRINITY_DN69864_c0_g1_i1.p1 TRINITY_DN69864_c0_g1~~TRINITY_DN69864_c0_g1_i1.p1  ORF type:complete len:227 (-),score=20.34 TRINITY_DN69864_c0_g1_i1:93-773(-)
MPKLVEMALTPWNDDRIWKTVCAKELDAWAGELQAKGDARGVVQEYFRVPMPGEVVAISGVRGRPELNGARGSIVSGSLDEQGRVTVLLHETNKKMNIQPARLTPLQSASSPSMRTMATMSMHGGPHLIGDGGSSVRSCSRAGSIAGSGYNGNHRSVSACSAASRSNLSGAGALTFKAPMPPVISSGTGWLHLQARGGMPSKFNEPLGTRKITGDACEKDRPTAVR